MQTTKKPGPIAGTRPSAPTIRTSVMLEPDMVEWGKQQPGGLSALLRRLMTQEREAGKANSK